MKQPRVQNCVIVTIADTGFLPAACCTLVSTMQEPPENMNISRLLLAVDVQEIEIAKANGFLKSHGVESCVSHVSSKGLLDPGFRVDGHVTRASYVRLALDRFIASDVDKVLYLDADTRIMSPLGPLLQTNLMGCCLGAVHDLSLYVQDRLARRNRALGRPADTDYFNAGVLIFNWPQLLEQNILGRSRRFAARYPEICTSHDQDALNAVIAGDYLPLDPRWNLIHYYYINGGNKTAWIKHYTGAKPWERKRPRVWTDDARWYEQVLAGSPWQQFFEQQTWLDRLAMRWSGMCENLPNYRRVLGACLVPFLMKGEAHKRARQFMAFDPCEVVCTANSWMSNGSSADASATVDDPAQHDLHDQKTPSA